MRLFSLAMLLLGLITLAGCTSSPKVASDVDRSLTPKQAVTSARTERRLQWGGVIIETQNLAETTELQILAYPLEANGKPDLEASPQGRFIAQHAGYLETVDYAKGRRVTVTGSFSQVRSSEVGSSPYEFPLLLADEIVLWPKQQTGETKPRVNFGFGVGSGGRSWGGVGIGIGF